MLKTRILRRFSVRLVESVPKRPAGWKLAPHGCVRRVCGSSPTRPGKVLRVNRPSAVGRQRELGRRQAVYAAPVRARVERDHRRKYIKIKNAKRAQDYGDRVFD